MKETRSIFLLTAEIKLEFVSLLCRDHELEASDKLIALALLNHLNPGNGTSRVTNSTLIGDTGLCDKTVRTSLRRLEHRGWFDVQRESHSHLYHPAWLRLGEALPDLAA